MEPDTTTIVYIVAEILLSIEISISNALVLWVYFRSNQVRTPTNAFIFSLALADFLAGSIGIPVTVFSVVDYRYLVYVIFFATIVLPTLLIVFCYASIYSRIRYEEKQIKCLLRASERQRRIHNRRKLIRILLILVITYAVCWYPLYLINTVDLYFPQYHSTKEMTLFSVVLSHFGCAINPIIYAYGMPGFKQALRKFFHIGDTVGMTTMSMTNNRQSTVGNCSCLMKGNSLTEKERRKASRTASYIQPPRKKSHVRFENIRKISEPPTMSTSHTDVYMSPIRVTKINGFERREYVC
uniref:G-protein coupled receptors family 1 profile domain-containing protein n=1 Tax=Panagrolaimus davidi TaxID=227884 RepID=A0A914PXD1_9BILA